MTRMAAARFILFMSILFVQANIIAPVSVDAARVQKKQVQYACPMHPEFKSKSPGNCPKCGMRLKAVTGEQATGQPKESAGDKSAAESLVMRIPDTTVYDQNGNKLRFYTDLVKGKTVAIEFIFTTCTTICPPLTATFRKVQQELGNRVGRNIELI